MSINPRKAHKEVKIVQNSSANPDPKRDRAIVPLCCMRDEIKPADNEPINTPTDPDKNRDPAWLGDSINSVLMAGINGAKIKRLRKVVKNSSVRNRILLITPLNGCGWGHVLSCMMFHWGLQSILLRAVFIVGKALNHIASGSLNMVTDGFNTP